MLRRIQICQSVWGCKKVRYATCQLRSRVYFDKSNYQKICAGLKWETRYFPTTITLWPHEYIYICCNMIIPHSVYVGVVLSTVNYFILTANLEVLCTPVVHHIMWCNQSQKFYYIQGCVKKHNMQSLLHSQHMYDWLSTLLEISCISIPHTWIFLTHWGKNNTVQKGSYYILRHKYQISLFLNLLERL